MQTLRKPFMQAPIQPPVVRSLPLMLRAPQHVQAQLVRPPLPVRCEQMSVTEIRIYQMLRIMFVLIPLVAGVDKFYYHITDWDRYVPTVFNALHIQAHMIMVAAGLVEIFVAFLIATKPKVGAVAMILLLTGIMLDLVAIPRQQPILLLDCSLCVSSLCLFLLASKQEILRRLN